MGKGNYTFIEGRITVDLGYCSSIVKNIWTYSVNKIVKNSPLRHCDHWQRKRENLLHVQLYDWNIHVGSGNTIQIILWIHVFTFCWLMSTSASSSSWICSVPVSMLWIVICVLLRYLDIFLDLLLVVIVGHRMGQQLGEH